MNANTEDLAGILRRVQKLLAIAQDDRANPEEASAAAGMAERIMRKYQIDHADVIMTSIKSGADMETADVLATAKNNGTKVERTPPWAQWMSMGIGKLNDCGVCLAYAEDGQQVIRFYGFKADVQVAAFTLNYLVATVNRLCDQYRKTAEYQVFGRVAGSSYRKGVAQGILSAINKLAKEKEDEAKTMSTSTALVVVKKQAIAEHFGDGVFKVINRRSNSRVVGHSFSAGFAAGKAVDVNRRAVGNTLNSTCRLH